MSQAERHNRKVVRERPAQISVIAVAETSPAMDAWTKFVNSKAIFIIIIMVYIMCGTFFYRYYDLMTWTQAYYYATDSGFRIGFTTPTTDIDNFSKVFSVFFKMVGVGIMAFFYTVLLRSSYFQRSAVRFERILTAALVMIISLVFGTLWSYLVVDWSFVNGIYFVFSTCFWWGTYSVPTDSSNGTLITTALITCIGGLAVFVFFVFLVAEVEVYIERNFLIKAATQSFTSAEMGIIEKLLNKEKEEQENAQAAADPMVKRESDISNIIDENESKGDEEDHPLLFEPEPNLLLSKNVVEQLLLLRVLQLDDVTIVYYNVRMYLVGAFAIFLLCGMLFYKYYDGATYWCLALNYSISSFYRLGYSNDDVDGFSQIISTLLMLIGFCLFNLLNVCITREFGLKARGIRYFHTILDGLLCLILCSLVIAMFMEEYVWTGVDSFVFAMDVMMGYGNNVPTGESVWSYWLLDFYTIAIIPLFVAYVSHVEVELDIGDALGYMTRALSLSFTKHDLKLVQIHDDFVDKRYAVADREQRSNSFMSDLSYVEEEDLSLSRNEFGTYELHVLLVLRLKDFGKDHMKRMVKEVNAHYNKALIEELEVFPCYNEDDVRIVVDNIATGVVPVGRRSSHSDSENESWHS